MSGVVLSIGEPWSRVGWACSLSGHCTGFQVLEEGSYLEHYKVTVVLWPRFPSSDTSELY